MLTTTRTGAGSTPPSRPSLAGTVPLPATSTSTTTSWGTTSWRPTGRPRPSSRPPQQTSRTAGRRRPATRATPACAQCRRRRLAASRRPARHHRRRPLPAPPCLPWLRPDVSVFIPRQSAAGDACFNMLQPASVLWDCTFLRHCSSCTGAPAANRTYFCDASDANCYIVIRTLDSNFSDAKSYCESVSGGLVSYSSREKQLLVGGAVAATALNARVWEAQAAEARIGAFTPVCRS